MDRIQTKRFDLAVYSAGDKHSPKVALLLPGKLDSKDNLHLKSHVEHLAAEGFFALSIDAPGTWESGGDLSLYTMTNYIAAVNEVLSVLGNRQTFLAGHSLGGSIAMYVGARNKAVTHFAALMSPYSFSPEVRNTYPDKEWEERGYRVSMRTNPKRLTEKREYKLPYAYLEDQIQYDMTDDLKLCPKPKLFVLGTQDTVIEPEIVLKSFEYAAPPKMLQKIDAGHDYRTDPAQIEQVNRYLSEFLAEHWV